MDVHKNARLTPRGREEMVLVVVEQGLTTAQAARRFFTSAKTVKKWVERYQELGVAGLRDRSSRPHSSPRRTPPATCLAAETLRRQRHTQSHFATALSLSLATGSRLMAARGLSRLAAIQPGEPRPCYERKAPGELSHIDIKKLGKFWKTGFRITGRKTGHKRSDGAGYEFAHVAIDDHSRIARIDLLPDERKESAVLCLQRTVAHFQRLGVRVERVMTDNGSCYRSRAFANACRALGIRHIMTKPYTPQTNGKAERFIQTALREWAYATAFETSDERKAALPEWLHRYNWHRPHASLDKKPPISRIRLTQNNLLQLHS